MDFKPLSTRRCRLLSSLTSCLLTCQVHFSGGLTATYYQEIVASNVCVEASTEARALLYYVHLNCTNTAFAAIDDSKVLKRVLPLNPRYHG